MVDLKYDPDTKKVSVDGVEYAPVVEDDKDEDNICIDGHELKIGDEYFFVDVDGDVEVDSYGAYEVHDNIISQGNAYSSKEEAELASKRRALTTRYLEEIRKFNAAQGWVYDWSDEDQTKGRINFNHHAERFNIGYDFEWQYLPSEYYFGSTLSLDVLLDLFTESELKLIITGEE